MSEVAVVPEARTGIRIWLGVFGVLSVIAGIIIVAHPEASGRAAAIFLTLFVGIYTIIAGFTYLFSGIFSKGVSGWSRVLRIVLGILAVVAGFIVTFTPVASAPWLIYFFVIMIGVTWITEGFLTFANLGQVASKGWSVFFAIISIIAGLVLIFTPLMGALVMWWVIGISLIVWGVVEVVSAFISR